MITIIPADTRLAALEQQIKNLSAALILERTERQSEIDSLKSRLGGASDHLGRRVDKLWDYLVSRPTR